jgi:hypothetical protein
VRRSTPTRRRSCNVWQIGIRIERLRVGSSGLEVISRFEIGDQSRVRRRPA